MGRRGHLGVHEGIGGRKLLAGKVVVGDDDGESAGLEAGDLFDGVDSVVDGDDELYRGILREHAGDARRGHAVSLLEALREEHRGLGAGLGYGADRNRKDGARTDAVAVVVAEDDDLVAARDGIEDHLGGGLDARQVGRTREVGDGGRKESGRLFSRDAPRGKESGKERGVAGGYETADQRFRRLPLEPGVQRGTSWHQPWVSSRSPYCMPWTVSKSF